MSSTRPDREGIEVDRATSAFETTYGATRPVIQLDQLPHMGVPERKGSRHVTTRRREFMSTSAIARARRART